MASYEAWNKGIINYFLSGEPKGSHIFLSLDEEAILDMCELGFIDEELSLSPFDDFRNAVICKCLNKKMDRVDLEVFKNKTTMSIPSGVGFLSAMVLSAYQMDVDDQGEIDESNYFFRFREFLKIENTGKGRPNGMPAGSEDSLWKDWNGFLIENGFLPTAKQGKQGPRKFLEYVISQTILRESDKRYLKKYYKDKGFQTGFDSGQLGFCLAREKTIRQHLKDGLNHNDQSRVWAFYQACQRVYLSDDWRNNNYDSHTSSQAFQHRKIECGIFRSESLFGEVEYLIFPKQPARLKKDQEQLYVIQGNEKEKLEVYRPGFYRPLWEIEPIRDDLIELKIEGSSLIKSMIFPKRNFWILSCDPEGENGSYATWKPFMDLGEKLLVICSADKFTNEMQRFRDAGLLKWKDEIKKDKYHEFHDVMIASYNWGGFISDPECKDLAIAIAPKVLANISLSGGLRDLNQNAWLDGYPPTIKIYGFQNEFEICINNTDNEPAIKEYLKNQEEFNLPNLNPGIYSIEAKINEEIVATKMFRIIPWSQISISTHLTKNENCHPSSSANIKLRGPIIT